MLTAYAITANAEEVASGTALELAKLIELIVTKIPLWIAGGIVVVLSVIMAKVVRAIVIRKLADKGIEEEHQELQVLGGRLAYFTVLVLGVTVGLKIAGIDLTTIIAAVAFGIGFALKDLIMNFLAGIMLLVSKHFTIGDFISVGGTIGRVEEIQSRVTVLKAIDGTKVVVPNAQMFKKQVTSFTSNPFRRIELVVGVDYRHKLDNVLKLVLNTTVNTKGVLKQPKPAVLVSNFGDSAVEVKIKAWVSSTGGWVKIKSELAQNIKKSFEEHGIIIPWPIRQSAQVAEINEKEFVEPEVDHEKEAEQTPLTPQPQEVDIETDESQLLPKTEQR